MDEAIETIEYRGHEIKIYQDTDAESPREFDNIGTMMCAHRNYNLGDAQADGDAIREKAAEVEKAGGIVLPLYLYDHSGITMNTTGFSCPWDSGQVGIIYVMPEKGREEFGRQWKKKATKYLKGEVETYDQYLTGDVYGYVVEGPDSNDSCWGFFGKKYAIEEAKGNIDASIQHEAKQSKLCAEVTAI